MGALNVVRVARPVAITVVLTAAAAGLAGTTVQAAPQRAGTARHVVSVGECSGVSVGQEREVVSDATRDRLGLDGWPDAAFGVVPQGNGIYRFHTAAAFGGTHPERPQRNVITQGSLDNPVRDGVVSSTQIQGLPGGYIWAGGGPLYHDRRTGIVLQTLHLEQRLRDNDFYSELHLGRLDPATGVTTYLGPLVQPDIDFADAIWNADLGMPSLSVVRDATGTDFLHLYFADFRLVNGYQIPTGLSVARAPLQEVLTAADQGTVAEWRKYSGEGHWDEPAWGGASADINPGRPMAWAPQVLRSTALGGYVMAAAVSPREMVLSTSPDGVKDWQARAPLLRDPAYYNAYATLVGESPDPADLGREFYLYYLQWPSSNPNWDNARVMRRTVTCTDGQPASHKPFVRYAKGPRHIVTTGTAPAGYQRGPGNDWHLWSGQRPGTRALYGCRNGAEDYFISPDPDCEGKQFTIMQTEGWIHTKPPPSPHTALYRCHIPGLGDHFVSIDPNCEGPGITPEGLLGYAPVSVGPLPTPSPPRSMRHKGMKFPN